MGAQWKSWEAGWARATCILKELCTNCLILNLLGEFRVANHFTKYRPFGKEIVTESLHFLNFYFLALNFYFLTSKKSMSL